MAMLSDQQAVAQRILDHVRDATTDLSACGWREPVVHYQSPDRFTAELEGVLRRHPTPLCPSAALPRTGSFLARDAAGTPIVAVRDATGRVRAFRNACRHRGTQLVDGSGCAKAFVCPYHSWTYRLDGSLRHVPHAHGFPDLDRGDRGLVPVTCWERHGLVLVTQDGDAAPDSALDELAGLIGPDHQLLAATQREEPTNWKVLAETFLEGYHLRFTHPDTFFPVQFDNLNLVESFGPNSRVTFPFRNIVKLAPIAPGDRTIDGRLTFVYHLFPNVMVATFPDRILVIVLEPTALDRTTIVTYALSDGDRPTRGDGDAPRLPAGDLLGAGAEQDFAVARAVQRGLASGANDHLDFGLFEGAIGHFHRTLDAALEQQ